MGEPAYQLPEEDRPDIRPDLRAQEERPKFGVVEGGGETTPKKDGHLRSVDAGDEESRALGHDSKSKTNKDGSDNDSDYGPSALDDIRNRVGKGYNKDGEKKKFLSKLLPNSKVKKRIAISTAIAGGGVAASIFMFTAMLPIKIVSLVSMFEERAGAASSAALDKEGQHLLNRYMVKYVFPNLNKGTCHKIVDPGCVSVVKGTGPVSKTFQAWRQTKFEQKLATKYDLAFGKRGDTYYIHTAAKNINIGDGSSIFGDGAHAGSRHEIENIISTRLKEGTLWDRVYYRFRVAPFLNNKYGIRHCINACKAINKFTDNVKTKKKAAEAYLIQRVISPLSSSYGLIAQCVLDGGDFCPKVNDKLSQVSNADGTRENVTPFQKKLQEQMVDFAGKFGKDSLDDLVRVSSDISKDGFSKVFARELASKIAQIVGGGSGEAAGAAAEKAVPVIGWVLLIARVINTAEQIGPILRYMSYAAFTYAAIQQATAYQTVADEAKSGQIDPVQLGSFNQALSTNLSGSSEDQSDATETPLYNALAGTANNNTSTALLNVLPGKTYASQASSSGGYKCDNGKGVPAGKLVCEEEKFDRGNGVANKISDSMHAIVDPIPGASTLLWVIGKVDELVGKAFGAAFNKICNINPVCKATVSKLGGYAGQFMSYMLKKMIASPFSNNMSGGRGSDMLYAGLDAKDNASCMEIIGCQRVDDKTAAAIQEQYLKKQQDTFNAQPFFARMFSTSEPRSLVSRLALSLPGSKLITARNFATGLLHNPLTVFGNFSSALFAHPTSAGSLVLANDPFGIPQNAYPDGDIPKYPDQYWDQHCQKDYDESTGEYDNSDWLSKQTLDKQTGQAVANTTNPCMLILAASQAVGGLSDASLLPGGSLNQDGTSDPGTGQEISFRIATYNIKTPDQTDGAGDPGNKWKDSSVRVPIAAKVVEQNKFEVIGFQEIAPTTFSRLKVALGSQYDSFPKHPGENGSLTSITPIFWDKERFSMVDFGTIGNAWRKCKGVELCNDIPWIKLRETGGQNTGQEFYVINTHMVNRNSASEQPASDPGGAEKREASAKEIMKKIQSFTDAPIFLTGDFNSSWMPSHDDPALHGDRTRLPYCILTTGGQLVNVYDLANSRKGACPTKDAPYRIDHIYTSPDIRVSDQQFVVNSETKTASDHNPLYADVSFGSSDASGAGADFTISSFNIYFSSDKDHADYSIKKWRERLARSVSVLKKQDIAVAGLQEVRENQWSALQTNADDMLGDGWGIYPSNYKAAGYAAQNPIVWNKSDFTFVSGKTLPGGRLTSPGVQPNSSVLVRLRSNTGQEIYLLNVHEPVHNGTQVLARYQSALEHAKQIKELGADGIPIFVTGDFNSSYAPNSRQSTWQNKKENMAYCILTNGTGLWDALDAEKNNKGHCTSSSGPVDHVFMSTSVSVPRGGYSYSIGPPQNGSDVHHTLIVKVNIAGSGS